MKAWGKIVKGIVMVLVLSVALVGCGNEKKGSTSSSESKSSSQEKNVTLRFFWWGSDERHQATQAMIENFEKNNSTIQVEGEPVGFGSIDEKVTTMIAGGTEPDIMQLDVGQVYRFSTDGKGFYDLNKLKDIIDMSQYDKDFLKSAEINGKQNGIPLGKNVLGVILNKSAFERVGAEIPTTWDELKEAAKKFPDGSYPLVVTQPRYATGIYLQQKTGKSEFDKKGNMNYTKKDYKAALKWYMEMVDAKAFCSRKDYIENVGTEPVSLAQNAKFINGEYAGVLEWTGGISANEAALKEAGDELVILPDMLKITENGDSNTLAKPTFILSIKKDEKNPKQAAKFLNDFINGKEANKLLGVTRGVPASKAASKVLTDNGQISGAVKDGAEYSQDVKSINETVFYEDSTLQTIVSQALEQMELNNKSLEDAAEEVYTKTKTQAEQLSTQYGLE